MTVYRIQKKNMLFIEENIKQARDLALLTDEINMLADVDFFLFFWQMKMIFNTIELPNCQFKAVKIHHKKSSEARRMMTMSKILVSDHQTYI